MKGTDKSVKISLLLPALFFPLHAAAQSAADTVSMTGKTHAIEEVVVRGRSVVRKDDHLQITPSRTLKANAHDGYSALALLVIPGLNVDAIDKAVTTRGEGTLLCINGREVKSAEVSALNPMDIRRIDYYQTFSPDHPTATSVIDFIMRTHDHGGQVYLEAKEHLNAVKGGDMADVKQYFSRSEINAQVSGSYTHFTPEGGSETLTRMTLPVGVVEKRETLLGSPQRQNGITGRLSYLHNGKCGTFGTMFHATATMSASHSLAAKTLSEDWDGSATTATDSRHRDNTSPAAQLYFQAKKGSAIIRASLLGRYSETDQWRDYSSTIADNSLTHERFWYLKPSLTLSAPVGRHVPFVSAVYDYSNARNIYTDNEKEAMSRLTTGYGIFLLGDNFQLIPKKLRFTLQMGARLVTTDDGTLSETKAYFSPSLFFTANITKRQTLTGNVAYGTDAPSISQYNDNEQRLDKYQTLRGNPDLLTSKMFSARATYNMQTAWGEVEIFSRYERHEDAVYREAELDAARGLFVHTYRNGGTWQRALINAAATTAIIPDMLFAAGSVEFSYDCGRFPEFHAERHVNYGAQLVYMKGRMSGKAELSSPTVSYAGATRTRYPMQLTLSWGMTYRSWHLDLVARNPFFKTETETEYLREDYGKTSRTFSPRISRSLFAATLSYRFSYGKKHRFQKIDMDDSTRTAILDE